jgi:PAS domain S-box-containing protein
MTTPHSTRSTSPNPNWPGPSVSLDELPVAYIEIDEKGIIRYANEAAYTLHEIPSVELIGREIWHLLPPDEAALSRSAFSANMASGEEPVTVRRSLFNTHGEFRIQEFHRRMLRHPDGKAAGISAVIFDVSQLESAAQELQHQATWLESILASIPTPLLVTDPLGLISYANPAAEKLTGWSSAELVSNPIELIFPTSKAGIAFESGSAEQSSPDGHSFENLIGESCTQDFELVPRHGTHIKVQVTASPVLDKDSDYASGLLIAIALSKP